MGNKQACDSHETLYATYATKTYIIQNKIVQKFHFDYQNKLYYNKGFCVGVFMKIEKRKITNGIRFSNATKTAIAATFGFATAAVMSGCNEESDSIAGPTPPPTPTSSETSESSSSKITDIPLSHEPLSSTAIEALSSAAQSAQSAQSVSSSSIKTASSSEEKSNTKYSSSYVSSGVSSAMLPTPKSSSATILSSSAADTSSSVTTQQSSSSQTESAATSSSDAQTISSSEAPISSSQASSNPIETNSSSSITPQPTSASFPYRPSVDCLMDSTGLKVIMCQDEHGGMMGSMVSTYDMTETI